MPVIFLTAGCVATQEDVGGLYARQNKLEARMDRLNEQVDVIKTKSFGEQAGTSNISDQVFQLETRLYELEQRISDMDRRIETVRRDIQGLKSTVSRQSSRPAAGTGQTTKTPAAEKEPELSDFDKGYMNLSEGKYKLAREQFSRFIKDNPESEKAADAKFWIADSYYREGKYEEAILAYQNLIDQHPGDSRVPLAHLKQGLSLMNLDKNEEAKLFFETLIDKYPDSDEADEARKKLQVLEQKG